MNRRTFLQKTLAAAAAVVAAPRALRAAETADAAAPAPGDAPLGRPNIVLVLVDDMGATDAACCGSKFYDTPNIDRLAAQGMRFTQGYAACAVCSPTRAAVMTGRYPARLGVTDWIRARFQGGEIPKDAKPPDGWVGGKDKPLLCPENALWMNLDEVTIAEALKPAGYVSCHIGKWHLGPDEWYPTKQGFDFNLGGCDYGQPPSYFDPYQRQGQDGIPTLPPRKEGEYLTDREADEAVRFIRDHKDKPFYLNMAHYAVHTPIQGKPDLVEKYKAKPPTEQKNAAYAAMVQSVDEALGKILAALDDCGIAGRTLVVFTSDNGGLLPVTDNSPLRSGKGHPYEGGLRVPLIVRWPGVVAAGQACDAPVCSIDLLPTFCEAAEAPRPKERVIDGESIMPLIKRAGNLKRDSLYWHFPHYRGEVVPYSIVRQGNLKLIRHWEGPRWELFDLVADPGEQNDLAAARPDDVKRLDARLTDWLSWVGAKLPKPNPDYDPAVRAKQAEKAAKKAAEKAEKAAEKAG
jgi:arylsulfatase A-like enzyme